MKNYIILPIIFACAFASCDIRMDDVFDRTAAERIDKMVAEAYETLAAAPNGWIMEYYPQENQKYGGVNILMRFDADNGVVMINENAEITKDAGGNPVIKTEKSTYTIDRSSGAALAFDTYNEYISYYADPGIREGAGRRYGFEGDLNFAIKSLSDSEIVLKGAKTGNHIIMKPVPADVTWEEYLDRIQTIKSDIKAAFVTRLEATVGDKKQMMQIDPVYTVLSFTYEDENGDTHSDEYSYMYTDTGIKFYEPVELFGEKMQNLTWNKEETSFICTDSGASGMMLGKKSEYFREYDFFLGKWKFYSYAANGTANQTMTITISELVPNESYKVSGLAFTHATYGTFNFSFRMDWNSTGRVSILNGQRLGTVNPVVSNVQYYDAPVFLYSCSATSQYRSTVGAGMISKTTLADNRVDFENNGVAINATGFGYYFYTDPTLAGSPISGGLRWLVTMYMVKE